MATITDPEYPKSIDEFVKYVHKKFKDSMGFGDRFEKFYEFNRNYLKTGFESSTFWREFEEGLKDIDTIYRRDNEGLVLIRDYKISIHSKPTSSVIDKAFRYSIKKNEHPPDTQENLKQFILPEHVFEKIDDIVRAEVVVRYLDGIDLVLALLTSLAKKHDYESYIKLKQEDEGYYAKHFYGSYNAKISDPEGNPSAIKFTFEIQLRTQLQHTIKAILHKYYEKDRIKYETSDEDWRWAYNKTRFMTNHIGHILHFFDGVIVKVKKSKEE